MTSPIGFSALHYITLGLVIMFSRKNFNHFTRVKRNRKDETSSSGRLKTSVADLISSDCFVL